jgi:hypothetical protein
MDRFDPLEGVEIPDDISGIDDGPTILEVDISDFEGTGASPLFFSIGLSTIAESLVSLVIQTALERLKEYYGDREPGRANRTVVIQGTLSTPNMAGMEDSRTIIITFKYDDPVNTWMVSVTPTYGSCRHEHCDDE